MKYKTVNDYRISGENKTRRKSTVKRAEPSPYRYEKKKKRESEGIFKQ